MYPLLLYHSIRKKPKLISGQDERSSKMAVKLIDELQKEIKAAGEAVTQEAYEKAYDC